MTWTIEQPCTVLNVNYYSPTILPIFLETPSTIVLSAVSGPATGFQTSTRVTPRLLRLDSSLVFHHSPADRKIRKNIYFVRVFLYSVKSNVSNSFSETYARFRIRVRRERKTDVVDSAARVYT